MPSLLLMLLLLLRQLLLLLLMLLLLLLLLLWLLLLLLLLLVYLNRAILLTKILLQVRILGSLGDCCQYESSRRLELLVSGEEARVRSGSIWRPGPVLALAAEAGDVVVERGAQVKTGYVELLKARSVFNLGLVVALQGGVVEAEDRFANAGVWIGEEEASRTEVPS